MRACFFNNSTTVGWIRLARELADITVRLGHRSKSQQCQCDVVQSIAYYRWVSGHGHSDVSLSWLNQYLLLRYIFSISLVDVYVVVDMCGHQMPVMFSFRFLTPAS